MNKHESILRLASPKLLIRSAVNDTNIDKPVADYKDELKQSHSVYPNDEKDSFAFKIIDPIESKRSKLRQKKKGAKSRLYERKEVFGVKNNVAENADAINSTSSAENLKNKTKRKFENLEFDNKSAVRRSVNEIQLSNLLTVQELANRLGVPSTDIIKWLFLKGISVTINQLLDNSISALVAEHYSFNVLKNDTATKIAPSVNASIALNGRSRAPIITILGHVDHGKTALLQAIRKDNFLIHEAGNITQSIGSYEVYVDHDQDNVKLIFLDTPGHEAFMSMRKRGVSIADLAILVVSADEGLKPQTVEAINYIQSNHLAFLVAINKIDKPEADIAKVRKQLSSFNSKDQNFNADSFIIPVSALTGQNINLLLSSIISLSKAQKLKSDLSVRAEGVILEAYLSKQKGPVSQLLVQNGILHVGDIVVAGNCYGKVKAISNSLNQKVKSIVSASLADVLCFTEVPIAGMYFRVVNNEKTAKALASNHPAEEMLTALNTRISLDNASQKNAKKIIKQVNLIIKTAAQGAIDAIIDTLYRLPQEKVQINLLLAATGEVSLKDIELAYASKSIILAFRLKVSSSIFNSAVKRRVDLHVFSVIYDVIDYVKERMLSFVELDYEKQFIGRAKVKNLFTINKGTAVGCLIENGRLRKKSYFQLQRSGQIIYNGIIDSLKLLKDDTEEVTEGNECGIMCKEFSSWAIDDLLECYSLKPIEKTL